LTQPTPYQSITIAWDDNSTTETGFRIERSLDGTTNWTQIGTTGGSVTVYRDTGLAPSTTYYYRVRAYTSTENSDYSNVAGAAGR
jgi:titin